MHHIIRHHIHHTDSLITAGGTRLTTTTRFQRWAAGIPGPRDPMPWPSRIAFPSPSHNDTFNSPSFHRFNCSQRDLCLTLHNSLWPARRIFDGEGSSGPRRPHNACSRARADGGTLPTSRLWASSRRPRTRVGTSSATHARGSPRSPVCARFPGRASCLECLGSTRVGTSCRWVFGLGRHPFFRLLADQLTN